MITLNTIYNENCNETMKRMADKSCDLILTSPPYNSGRGHTIDKRNPHVGRYDIYLDNMNTDEYLKWTVDLFNSFDRVLNDDGVVLYNISYGSDTKHKSAIGLMWLVVAEIIKILISLWQIVLFGKRDQLYLIAPVQTNSLEFVKMFLCL